MVKINQSITVVITQIVWNKNDVNAFTTLQYISKSFRPAVYSILDAEIIKEDANSTALGLLEDKTMLERVMAEKNFRSNWFGGIEWLVKFEATCKTIDVALLNKNMEFIRCLVKILKTLDPYRGIMWTSLFRCLPDADEDVGVYIISELIDNWSFGSYMLIESINHRYGEGLPYWTKYVSKKFMDNHSDRFMSIFSGYLATRNMQVAWYDLYEKLFFKS